MSADQPLEFSSITASPAGEDKLLLQLEGRWRARHRPDDARPTLEVEAAGNLHYVPAVRQPKRRRPSRPRVWGSCFEIPHRLVPLLEGHTSLRLGHLSIPLPPGSLEQVSRLASAQAPAAAPGDTVPVMAGSDDRGADSAAAVTAEALREELRRRTAAEAAVRGELTELQAELASSSAGNERLEAIQAELRDELGALREIVERQGEAYERTERLAARVGQLEAELAQVREALAISEVVREAAQAEAAGLRAELERIGTDLVAARREAPIDHDQLDEAQALLAQARALRTRVAEQSVGGPS